QVLVAREAREQAHHLVAGVEDERPRARRLLEEPRLHRFILPDRRRPRRGRAQRPMLRPGPNCPGGTLAGVTPDVAAVALLIGERARLAMLDALVDERDLPASELAHRAGISASTASAHLAKLVEGGLVEVERSGRHRRYRL